MLNPAKHARFCYLFLIRVKGLGAYLTIWEGRVYFDYCGLEQKVAQNR